MTQSVVCASTETIARDVNRTRNAKRVILRRDADIVDVDAIARRSKSKSPRGSIESKRIESKRIESNFRSFSNAVTSGETLRQKFVRFVCYSVTRDALNNLFSSRPRARV